LTGRFAPVRVRCAGSNAGKARLLPEQWLLIEWPASQAEPEKYYLCTLPETATINDLVVAAHMRWRIERDYQDLKQDLGLGHYEGRGWTGFHHHTSLSVAAYGYLMAQRLRTGKEVGGKKPLCNAKCLPFSKITSLGAAQRTQRHVPNSMTKLRLRLAASLAASLGHYPHCSYVNPHLRL
jgi:SRSO17 transposase